MVWTAAWRTCAWRAKRSPMVDRLRILRLARRTIWQAVPTVLGILLHSFLLLRLSLSDAVDVLARECCGASDARLALWREQHGLDWLLDRFSHAILPVLTLSTFYIAL